MSVAESETKKFATLVINDAVSNELSSKITKKLIKTSDNSFEFNTLKVNEALTAITNNVLFNLKCIEEGNIESLNVSDEIFDSYNKKNLEKGIIYRIPTGVIFSNSLLNNIGPKIPVKLNFLGNIDSNISTKTNNYGINNVLVEVYVNLSVTMEIVLPLISKKTKVKTSIPVIMKMIEGNIPDYYAGDKTSALSIPIE